MKDMTLMATVAAIITAVATTIAVIIAYKAELRLKQAASKDIEKERYSIFYEISIFMKWMQDIIPFLDGMLDIHYRDTTINELLKNNISKKKSLNSTFQYWKEYGNSVCYELLDTDSDKLKNFMDLIIDFSKLYDYLLNQIEENKEKKQVIFMRRY